MKTKVYGNLIKLFFIICMLSSNVALAQEGYYVDKDPRILKFQDDIINFLKQEKQIIVEEGSSRKADYSGKIFIHKCVDIFRAKGNDILLIHFGSLGDHCDKFWGLLSKQEMFLFYNIDDPDFLKFKKVNDPVIVTTITTYIKESTLDQ